MPELLLVSFFSGLATGAGALLAVVVGRAGPIVMPSLLGFSAGIGFIVIFFDLMPEAVRSGSWMVAAGGFGLGYLFGKLADFLFPHLPVSRMRRSGHTAPGSAKINLLKTGALFALGVAMHNLPEGMALGAGLEAGKGLGMLLAMAIGLHNIPEGMALCGVLILAGLGRLTAMTVVTGVGLMLPLGTVLSGAWLTAAPEMLSFILALGAGTMLYIIVSELIPQSCRMQPTLAKTGIAAGAILSLVLSIFL